MNKLDCFIATNSWIGIWGERFDSVIMMLFDINSLVTYNGGQ